MKKAVELMRDMLGVVTVQELIVVDLCLIVTVRAFSNLMHR